MKQVLSKYNKFIEILEEFKKFIINQIEVPVGIAKNFSLRDNIFALLVCIFSKVSVCLIGNILSFIFKYLVFFKGPPGSSKTLSIKLIEISAKGKSSKKELFKRLPCLIPIYY